MNILAPLAFLSLTQASQQTMSTDLKEQLVQAKHASLIDQSLNMNWSDNRPKTISERLYNLLYKDPPSDFDLKVDAHIARAKKPTNKRLRATTIDHDLNYAVDFPMFIGEMRIGPNQDLIDVVFDTGSDWLAVPDSSCIECEGNTVDNTNSQKTSTSSEKLTYGSAQLNGYTYRSKVCLSSQAASCVPDFEYYSFFEQTGLSAPLEGILGMCQDKQMLISNAYREVGPLFGNELWKEGGIVEPTFSFGFQGF